MTRWIALSLSLGAWLVLSSAAGAIQFRRPHTQNIGVNYGYDNNYGSTGCSDYRCGGYCYDGHTGTDFPLVLGSTVVAAAAGTVESVYNGCANYGSYGNTCGGYCGNHVKINHGGGYKSLYCHMRLNSITVSTGQSVSCGQSLGQSASSGSSTGPHLHFGAYVNGVADEPFSGTCGGPVSYWTSQGTYPHPIPSTSCGTTCACTVGAVQSKACGLCGTTTRTCLSSCQWGSWSSCSGQGVCSPGATQTGVCGDCGSRTRTCTSSCAWSSWGTCTGQGICTPGEVQNSTCGYCGSRSRSCTSTCYWEAWSTCTGQGVCASGTTQNQTCGNCGGQSRTCTSSCAWSSWSTCTGEGPCAAGTVETRACCDCGSQNRTCSTACQWSSYSACAGPDPGGGTQACNTGQLGLCADGTLRCVDGCRACQRTWTPTAETCDDRDEDCDGTVDNDFPEEIGANTPAWAAELLDVSYPSAVRVGDMQYVWMVFKNVGSRTWQPGDLWLYALSYEEDVASRFYDAETWAASDSPDIVSEVIAPGEQAVVGFTIRIPDVERGDRVSEAFQLMSPAGELIKCPTPRVEISVTPYSENEVETEVYFSDGSGASRSNDIGVQGGCSSTNPGTRSGSAALLLFALLLFVVRRKQGTGPRNP